MATRHKSAGKTGAWQLAELHSSRARAARKFFKETLFEISISLRHVGVTTIICRNSLACNGGFIELNGPLQSAAQSKNRVL